MDKIISTVSTQRLKNETHVQFNESVDNVFVKFDPQTLGINPWYVPYKAALNDETEALDFIGKSEWTQKIHDQDQIRDDIFRGFWNSVKGVIVVAVLSLLTGCKKPAEEIVQPPPPQLSQSSVSVAEGETSDEIRISGGMPPYAVSVAGTTAQIILILLSDTQFTVTGVSACNVTVMISGKDGGKTLLPVTVTKAFKADATIRVESNGQTYTDLPVHTRMHE
jgi:hypothetical protein